jgi:hypothetical protein
LTFRYWEAVRRTSNAWAALRHQHALGLADDVTAEQRLFQLRRT